MRRRVSLLLLLALGVVASTSGGPAFSPSAEASPVREVRQGMVSALVPKRWGVRPMPSRAAVAEGLQAAGDLRRWASLERRLIGLEAYWVDAAEVGLPSDYYYLVAGGPVLSRLPSGCERDRLEVLSDHRPQFDRRRFSPGDYVATAGGTCSRGRGARWASFVAAPGLAPWAGSGSPSRACTTPS